MSTTTIRSPPNSPHAKRYANRRPGSFTGTPGGEDDERTMERTRTRIPSPTKKHVGAKSRRTPSPVKKGSE